MFSGLALFMQMCPPTCRACAGSYQHFLSAPTTPPSHPAVWVLQALGLEFTMVGPGARLFAGWSAEGIKKGCMALQRLQPLSRWVCFRTLCRMSAITEAGACMNH